MPQFIDQIGHHIHLNKIPKRIISLVPSQTEFLWDIGLRDELVGITKFCVHPKELLNTKTIIGGTKRLNIEKIKALKPDLIIGNKEENEKEQITELQKEFNVWMSDIYTLNDALKMMKDLAEIIGKQKEEQLISAQIKSDLLSIKNNFQSKRVAYFIWNKPYMLAGQNTFIDDVLNHLGFVNACGNLVRYPEISQEELIQLNPEICLLSSEPFPFKNKHIQEIKTFLPYTKVNIVDGEMFSWYGSRLLHLKKYVQALTQFNSFRSSKA